MTDTGGFFVAILKKKENRRSVKESGTQKMVEPSAAADSEDESGARSSSSAILRAECDPFAHGNAGPRKGDLGRYVSLAAPCHDKDWAELREFYGLAHDGEFSRSNLFTQSENASSISWVPTSLAKGVMDFTLPRRLNIVRAGLPVFRRRERPGVACKHVLRQDTLDVVLPHLGRRVVVLTSAKDMRRILTDGVEGGGTPFEELSKTAADQVRALQRGSFCFVLRSGEEPASKP